MNSNLAFDFTVNKENNTITVKREFAANRELVWAAWTTPELLDQWWAPKPYLSQTKFMNFSEGGYWLYSMISPQGERHYCRADYKTVNPLTSFSYLDAFCDEEGTVGEPFPNSLWTNSFNENGTTTTVTCFIKYHSLSDLEKVVKLGFKEGLTMALGNLDQFIEAQQKLGA